MRACSARPVKDKPGRSLALRGVTKEEAAEAEKTDREATSRQLVLEAKWLLIEAEKMPLQGDREDLLEEGAESAEASRDGPAARFDRESRRRQRRRI